MKYLPALGAVLGAVVVGLLAVAMVNGDDDSPEETALATATMTPFATALPTSTPPPPGSTATPEPTPTPPIPVLAGCDQWPLEIYDVFEGLSLAAGLCLRQAESVTAMPSSCHSARACYFASTRSIWHLDPEAQDALAPSPLNVFSDSFVLVHELCHAHQHWQIIKEGLEDPLNTPLHSWERTQEGRAFIEAESRLPAGYLPLTTGGTIERFANACAAWLYPAEGFQEAWVGRHEPMRRFMETWLAR